MTFSQNILYTSTKLEEKIRFISKTDLVITRHVKSYGLLSVKMRSRLFSMPYPFQEARSLELAREKERACDFSGGGRYLRSRTGICEGANTILPQNWMFQGKNGIQSRIIVLY